MNDIRLILKEGTLTAPLSGEIDHHNARGIREVIDEMAGKTKPKELILDFSRVQFMDSSGMRLVVDRYRLMQMLEGSVIIADLSPKVEKVVSMVGLDELVKSEKGTVYRETDE